MDPAEEADVLIGEAALPRERVGAASSLRTAALWLAVWLLPVAALLVLPGVPPVFGQVALFFSKMALVTFGGAYAALAYVAQQAVEQFGWLKPGEMLDGLGLAETTPGPLIMVLQFVGFLAGFRAPGALPPLLAGTLAGLLTTWVTFVPCFLWIFAGAPLIGRLRGSRRLAGALSAITAAVAGVILNLAVWFGLRTLFAQVETVPLGPLRLDLPVPGSLDPAALLLTRVISCPTPTRVTLDLGYKAVSGDQPEGRRLEFPDLPDARQVLQNEEHLCVETERAGDFQPGDELLAIPRHICPTTALHRQVVVVTGGKVTDRWDVVARDRQLTI